MKKSMLLSLLLLSGAGIALANDTAESVTATVPATSTAAGIVTTGEVQAVVVSNPVVVVDSVAVVQVIPAVIEEELFEVVPVKKKVWVDETYVVEKPRTRIDTEVRTKTIKPPAPRLTRSASSSDGRVLNVRQDLPRQKKYEKKVKVKYTEQIEKTRRVQVEVVENTLVPVGRTRR